MKSIMKAIGRALAAIPRFVWSRVQIAGEWVSRLIAVPAVPVEDVAENESVVRVQPDEHLGYIRTVAACILSERVPPADLTGRLSEQEMDWLLACNTQMLKKVVRADDAALKAHVQNRKALKGVLLNDPETVAVYTRDQGDDEPDVEFGTALKYA